MRGQSVGQEYRIELSAFGRFGHLPVMLEIEAAVGLGVRMAPGGHVLAGAGNEGTESECAKHTRRQPTAPAGTRDRFPFPGRPDFSPSPAGSRTMASKRMVLPRKQRTCAALVRRFRVDGGPYGVSATATETTERQHGLSGISSRNGKNRTPSATHSTHAAPGSAGTSPNRTSRTHSSRPDWGVAGLCSCCTRNRTGKRP
jgi:hypothetical protein